jgi:hypothetical protein
MICTFYLPARIYNAKAQRNAGITAALLIFYLPARIYNTKAQRYAALLLLY